MDKDGPVDNVHEYLHSLGPDEVVSVLSGILVRWTGDGWEEVMAVETGHRPNWNRLTQAWTWEPLASAPV